MVNADFGNSDFLTAEPTIGPKPLGQEEDQVRPLLEVLEPDTLRKPLEI
jgi:hypothetical protein